MGNLWLRVLQYNYDHPISEHFGQNRTIDLVRCNYIWPELQNSIKFYVKSCTTCMCSKPQRHCPYGLLKQLPVPERPWNSISMDFIDKLPLSSGLTLSLSLLTNSPNNPSSSLQSIQSMCHYLPSCLYSMSFLSKEFCHTSPPTMVQNLCCPFSGPLGKPST